MSCLSLAIAPNTQMESMHQSIIKYDHISYTPFMPKSMIFFNKKKK